MQRLVLFDIDATLLLTGGAGQRAMTRAFEALCGAPDGFAGIPMAGRTDPRDPRRGPAPRGPEPRRRPAGPVPRGVRRLLGDELARPADGKTLMPGVRPLVETLANRDDVFLALLTGNFAEGARLKLDYFGLWAPFRCGAFGDDHHDRAALVPIARARAEALGGGPFTPDRTFVIGDTPLDVACALAWNARAIGVATGGYDTAALAASGAHHVFENLSDRDAFLAVLGSSAGLQPGPSVSSLGFLDVGLPSRSSPEGRVKAGGSAWESNPALPQSGRRPVLKTGRATGPHSLPH